MFNNYTAVTVHYTLQLCILNVAVMPHIIRMYVICSGRTDHYNVYDANLCSVIEWILIISCAWLFSLAGTEIL